MASCSHSAPLPLLAKVASVLQGQVTPAPEAASRIHIHATHLVAKYIQSPSQYNASIVCLSIYKSNLGKKQQRDENAKKVPSDEGQRWGCHGGWFGVWVEGIGEMQKHAFQWAIAPPGRCLWNTYIISKIRGAYGHACHARSRRRRGRGVWGHACHMRVLLVHHKFDNLGILQWDAQIWRKTFRTPCMDVLPHQNDLLLY